MPPPRNQILATPLLAEKIFSISVEVDEKEFGPPKPFDFSGVYRGLDAFQSQVPHLCLTSQVHSILHSLQVCSAVVARYEDSEDMILFLHRVPYE